MKSLFVLLVGLNVAYLVFQQLQEPSVAELADGPTGSGGPVHDGQVAAHGRLARRPPPVKPPQCVELGPFDRRSAAQQLASQLQDRGLTVSLNERPPVAVADYLVFVGPETSRAAARRRVAALRSQGIDSFVITHGPLTNALSLGVFADRPAAEHWLASLAGSGVIADIRAMKRQQPDYRLTTHLPPELLKLLREAHTPLRPCAASV